MRRVNRPQARFRRHTLDGRSAAFTLIEIMVVVIVLAILAATIIPQFTGTARDARVSVAKSHIKELESALERFNVHMDRYPTTEEGLDVLVDPPAQSAANWGGPYVKQVRLDPWNSEYVYVSPGQQSKNYDLWSRGPDGKDGVDDITSWDSGDARKKKE